MAFDDILKVVGEFGPYQRKKYALLCIISFTSAWHSLSIVFITATPKHICNYESRQISQHAKEYNFTSAELEKLAIPLESKDGKMRMKMCSMYNLDALEWNNSVTMTTMMKEYRESGWNASSEIVKLIQNETLTCINGWQYNKEFYQTTIVTDWNLVCDDKWLRSTAKSVFFAGRLVGAILGGQLSDRFGRRPLFFGSVFIQVILGVVVIFSPNIIVYTVILFFQGVVQVMVFLAAFVLGTEFIGPSKRKITGIVIQMFYSAGYCSLALIAYLVNDWKYLSLAVSLPGVLYISYWFLLPESARWLLTQGRDEEAKDIIKSMADDNKKPFDANIIDSLKADMIQTSTTYTPLSFFRELYVALISLNVWFNWLVNSLVYYGLAFNTDNLAGSPFVNFAILGAVEFPARILCILLIDRMGRRKLLCIFMAMGGAACIATPYFKDDRAVVGVTLAMFGKLCISGSYAIIYLYAAEIFPTVVRHLGMGISSMSARIGGILAPQVLLLDSLYTPLPLIVFGVTSILAGGLAMFLPETMGKPLCQTWDDMRRVHKKGDKNIGIDEDGIPPDVSKADLVVNEQSTRL